MAAAVFAAGLALQAVPAQAEEVELYVGIEGALLYDRGDPFEGFGGSLPPLTSVVPTNHVNPDDGWGGRVFAGLQMGPHFYGRIALNGAWLDGSEGLSQQFGSFDEDFDQLAELDAIWTTLEAFYTFPFGRPQRPHTILYLGGGLEHADLTNRFREEFEVTLSGNPLFSQHVEQETTFWGVGPRLTGMIDHELGQTGLHLFGEAGAAYLFGDRKSEFEAGSSMGSSFSDKDSQSERIWHLNGRVGLGYEFLLGDLDFRADLGWRQDWFENANNTLFLPEMRGGDSSFSGPFVQVGVGLPL